MDKFIGRYDSSIQELIYLIKKINQEVIESK